MTKNKLNFGAHWNAVSSKQWKQQIQFELNGADYNETLIWNSPEGIKVKPFYHRDENITNYKVNSQATKFKICQNIFVHDLEKSIYRANDSIARGAESLRFTIEDKSIDIEKLLNEINLENISVYFNLNFISIDFVIKINDFANKKGTKIYCNFDPIGHLAQDGNWIETIEKNNFEAINNISAIENLKLCGIISINAALFQNSGANIVQQIAYAVGQALEYFNNIQNINTQIVFQVAVGTNYFFEIAKLRALRLVFKAVATEFNHNLDCHILAAPTKRNKTIYDYNTNLLRTTTECMSAILSGADTIANLPYDNLYHKDNEFADRIARNQLLILKNESYFDKVNNQADGSYYIESLTNQLAEKALILLKEIENSGGFLKKLKDGTIKRKIQESANLEQELFNSGKEILLGTNKYPNKNDFMKNDLELFPFVKIKSRKTLISPIIENRLAEKMEQERLLAEDKSQSQEIISE